MQSKFKIILFLNLLLMFLPLANAGTIITDNQTRITDGISDQVEINQALSEGGDVYLTGKFVIDNGISIGSNTHLYSDDTAIIEVSPSSSQWFAEPKGIINPKEYPLKNVEISGFKIDGNLEQMNASFADSSKGIHDSERAIRLQGTKTEFMENISVHDMTVYNTFSDGINIGYCYNATCYNNLLCNCQHESIFFTCTLSSSIYNNEIAGINSNCIRLDNCMNTTVFNNVFYSYTGDNRNGQAPRGENGVQVADSGFSHGGGSYKPTSTKNVEVYNNTFATNGLRYIWLDSTGKGIKDVFIHDNKFIDDKEIETHWVSAEGVIYPNSPTLKKSMFQANGFFSSLGLIRDVKKDVYVKIENETVYPTVHVKAKWYDLEKDPATGKYKKEKIQAFEAVFNNSSPVSFLKSF
jgi:hypothetical protein